jgi:signal transduction histidine kinase/GAF domain-containing protein
VEEVPVDRAQVIDTVLNLARSVLAKPVAIWAIASNRQDISFALNAHGVIQHKSCYCRIGDEGLVRDLLRGEEQIIEINVDKRLHNLCRQLLPETTFILVYPIKFVGLAIGVFVVFGRHHDDLEKIPRDTLASLAEIVGSSIGNGERAARFARISEIAGHVNAASDLGSALQLIVDSARELTWADASVIFLQARETGQFETGSSSPPGQLVHEPRIEGGLTAQIIKTGESVHIRDTADDTRVRDDLRRSGIRSLLGVRVQRGKNSVGALYIRGRTANQFGDGDLEVLERLATLVPVALGWSHWVTEPAKDIDKAARLLLDLDKILAHVAQKIKQEGHFKSVAIQLIDKEERTIQTVHGTDSMADLVGLAKHPLNRDDALLDIQAWLAKSSPPRIVSIAGWDERLDRWIYEKFEHAKVVRVWVPMLVLRNSKGEIITDWSEISPWHETNEEERGVDRIDSEEVPIYKYEICLDIEKINKKYGKVSVEVIGTLEVARNRSTKRIEPTESIDLAAMVGCCAVSEWRVTGPNGSEGKTVPPIREALLDYVLETTARSAIRIVGGQLATLHFSYDHPRKRYSFEVWAGSIGPFFLAEHPPRERGLGYLAIKDGKPKTDPDLSAGQPPDNLRTSNLPAWNLGIRMMVAFPLFLGDKHGLLYIGFNDVRALTEDDKAWVERFLNRASQAIREVSHHRDALNQARHLLNLNVIARSLVAEPTDPNLLRKIGGNTINILAADTVTIHEYFQDGRDFLDAAVVGRLRDPSGEETINRHFSARKLIQENTEGIIVQNFDYYDAGAWTDVPTNLKHFLSSEGFCCRMGTVLKMGKETLGVMFIYYRVPYKLSSVDEKSVEILASHAALAIKIRRSYSSMKQALERRKRELSALREIDRMIVAYPDDLGPVHKLILESALAILGARTGAILLYNGWIDRLVVETHQGYPPGQQFPEFTLDQGVVGLAARTRRTQLLNDVNDLQWRGTYVQVMRETRSEMTVPLTDEKTHPLGVFNIEDTKPHAFGEDDIALVEMFAVQATIALHFVDLFKTHNRKVLSLKSLCIIANRLRTQPYVLDIVQRTFLTGLTARDGLALSRAMFFEYDTSRQILVGRMAVGALYEDEARQNWKRLAELERDLDNQGKSTMPWYLDEAERIAYELREGMGRDCPLSAAVKNVMIPLGTDCALTKCLGPSAEIVVTGYNENDELRNILERATGQTYQGHAFACVPLRGRQRILGAWIVDNRFLPVERHSTFDKDSLESYASAFVMTVEDEQLREQIIGEERFKAKQELISALGMLLSHEVARLTNAIDTLENKMNYIALPEGAHEKDIHDIMQIIMKSRTKILDSLMKFRQFSEEKPSKKEEINIANLLENVKVNYLSSHEANIVLNLTDGERWIQGDSFFLEEALSNIIDNSARMFPGCIIEMRAYGENPYDYRSNTIIEISDNGRGVEETRKKTIFEPGVTSNPGRGLGLGLAIAKKFIELHRGSIEEVGSFGEGARFIIHLPCSAGAPG